MSDVEEREDVIEEEVEEEAGAVEGAEEAELSDLLINLDQINTMIAVTELWDSIVSGKVSIEEAKKVRSRIEIPRPLEEGEEEVEEKPLERQKARPGPKKKARGSKGE